MKRGSPGAGKPHAGKYGESTPLRQRGGGGQNNLASALPSQNPGNFRGNDLKSGDISYDLVSQFC